MNRLILMAVTSVTFGLAGLAMAGAGETGHQHEGKMAKPMDKHAQHHPEKTHEPESMHEHHGSDHAGGRLAGEPGLEQDVSRTITLTADDSMRFSLEKLNLKKGETIKFIVTNTGAINHEFSIATKNEHLEHGKMMIKNPNMHHGPGGNSITLKPGETQSLIWKFDNARDIELACNLPGHYQAGMHVPVEVAK